MYMVWYPIDIKLNMYVNITHIMYVWIQKT